MGVRSLLLLLTKLSPPPARPDGVNRQRLFTRLDTGSARRLTLISTPAGFGKTTLLSSWYAAHAGHPAQAQGLVLAWLSLETSDNDPSRFWSYVLRALQLAHEATPDHPIMALDVSPRSAAEAFLTVLLNAFTPSLYAPASALPGDTILILDDYHLITNQAIHTAITFLLEHLPPQLHLLIATRSDPPLPLTRLRATGALTEIRAEDLRFSSEEIACFLQSVLPFPFSMEEAARLEAWTGGWIMPLHLAALAWRGSPDAGAFIASLHGDHHALVDYLTEEVFVRQPEDIQRFLLATSLLAQFTSPLCDAVLQRADSQGVLQRLERENLFVLPVDAAHRWYRYHVLFVDFLQERLRQTRPQEIAGFHSRAADWYLHNKPVHEDAAAQAIPHALAAGDTDGAARLIEEASGRMLWQSGEVATLLRWLAALPQEAFVARPHLALASAWALTHTGQFDAAEVRLRCVDGFLSAGSERAADPDERLLYRQISGEALAIRARIAAFYDDPAQASALSEQALQLLPEQADVLRADLLLNLGYAHLRANDVAAAGRAFDDARRIGKRSGNQRAVILASRYLAESFVTRGLLNEAANVYRQALRLVTASAGDAASISPAASMGPPLAAGMLYVRNALLLYERNNLEAALDQARQGLSLGLRSGEIKIIFPGYLALAQVYRGRGDLGEAWRVLREAERLADLYQSSWIDEGIAVAQARLHLAQGEISAAVRALSRDGWQMRSDQPALSHDCPQSIQLAWARVLLAQQRPDAAAELLRRVLDRSRREQPQASALHIVVLFAPALAASRAGEQALHLLTEALPPALAQGYTRVFVDEGAPMAALLRQIVLGGAAPGAGVLLTAFPANCLPESGQISHVFQPGPTLSAREREVIRLMAVGLSNQQIADRLVIALSTVRTHTKNIYRKLGAQGRVRAVARANALHLL